MKSFFSISILVLTATFSFAQTTANIVVGPTNSISLVQKSMKLPSIKFKDGSTIVLRYEAEVGIHAEMYKNGKNFDVVEPFADAKFVQVCEVDIDKDDKTEIVIASRTTADQFTIQILRKPEFETDWTLWSTITGQSTCDFPGDNTVNVYTIDGTKSSLRFNEDGTFKVITQ